MTQETTSCPDGHQWHDTLDGRVCAACLATAPADPITPDAVDDLKHKTTKLRSRDLDLLWRLVLQKDAVNDGLRDEVDRLRTVLA